MLFYKIKQGELRVADMLIATGLYSGDFEHKNDPYMTHLHAQGPLPVGIYLIGEPRDTKDHGPYFIPLGPISGFEMYGRRDFGIHGERILPPPGHASNGCIIAPLAVREQIGAHVGEYLVVLSGNW